MVNKRIRNFESFRSNKLNESVEERGGDYVLSIFLYHPEQLIWDPASSLVGQLSRAVFNFYNMPQ